MSELEIGKKAPNFDLPTDGGGNVKLSDLKGDKNVVVYFYPKDDTPGCTTEAVLFRNSIEEFRQADTMIIGISKDPVKKHDKFKEKYKLPFMLASDEKADTVAAYGSWVEKSMYGKKYMGIQRDTFLIDKQGKIAAIWRKVKPETHPAEVLEAARKLK